MIFNGIGGKILQACATEQNNCFDMTYILNGRLIADTTESYRALQILKQLTTSLRLTPEITVCEPFSEDLRHYDIVFQDEIPNSSEIDAYFSDLLRRLPGEWHVTPPLLLEDGRGQFAAALDYTNNPRDGIVWLNLELRHISAFVD